MAQCLFQQCLVKPEECIYGLGSSSRNGPKSIGYVQRSYYKLFHLMHVQKKYVLQAKSKSGPKKEFGLYIPFG